MQDGASAKLSGCQLSHGGPITVGWYTNGSRLGVTRVNFLGTLVSCRRLKRMVRRGEEINAEGDNENT